MKNKKNVSPMIPLNRLLPKVRRDRSNPGVHMHDLPNFCVGKNFGKQGNQALSSKNSNGEVPFFNMVSLSTKKLHQQL